MNMIEPCWHYLKRQIPSLELPNSAAQDVQNMAVEQLGRLIQSKGYFDYATHQISKFRGRLEKVVNVQGRNNFNG